MEKREIEKKLKLQKGKTGGFMQAGGARTNRRVSG